MTQQPVGDLDDFDPYHKWLGIPESRRPPTYYQLLGISEKEDDPETIEASADRQAKFVRQFLGGHYHKVASSILFQIDQARVTLLSHEARERYDSTLKRPRKRRPAVARLVSTVVRGYRTVGESSGLSREFLGVMSVIVGGFVVMYFVVFYFPWLSNSENKPDQLRPVAGKPPTATQTGTGQPVAISPAPRTQQGTSGPQSPASQEERQAKDAFEAAKRGHAAMQSADFAKAIHDFSEAIRLSPKYAYAYRARGEGWLAQQDLDKATADLTQAIVLDPKDVNSFVARGWVHVMKGQLDAALADSNQSIRLDPKFAAGFCLRGDVSFARQEIDKAIGDYDDAIQLNRNYAYAYRRRGQAWAAKQDFDTALKNYNEALRLNPNDPDGYRQRGDVWLAKRDLDRALGDWNTAVRLNPKDVMAYNALAWLQATSPNEKYRNGKSAIKFATKACDLTGWKNSWFFDTLAAAYAEAGDFEKAVYWQTKALAGAPEFNMREFQSHLDLYKSGKPCREQPKK